MQYKTFRETIQNITEATASMQAKAAAKKLMIKLYGKGTVTFESHSGGHFVEHLSVMNGDNHAHTFDPVTGKISKTAHVTSSYYGESVTNRTMPYKTFQETLQDLVEGKKADLVAAIKNRESKVKDPDNDVRLAGMRTRLGKMPDDVAKAVRGDTDADAAERSKEEDESQRNRDKTQKDDDERDENRRREDLSPEDRKAEDEKKAAVSKKKQERKDRYDKLTPKQKGAYNDRGGFKDDPWALGPDSVSDENKDPLDETTRQYKTFRETLQDINAKCQRHEES